MVDSWRIVNKNPFINRFDRVSEKNNQVKYVLTKRFCQDPLENYFGRKRSKGRRKDNPNLRTFRYEDNALHNSKIFRPISSNSRKDEEQNIEVKNAKPLLSHSLIQKRKTQNCYKYFWAVVFIFLCWSSYVYGFQILVKKRLF